MKTQNIEQEADREFEEDLLLKYKRDVGCLQTQEGGGKRKSVTEPK